MGGYPEAVIERQFRNAQRRLDGVVRQVEAGARPLYRSRQFRLAQQSAGKKRGPPGGPVLWIPMSHRGFPATHQAGCRAFWPRRAGEGEVRTTVGFAAMQISFGAS